VVIFIVFTNNRKSKLIFLKKDNEMPRLLQTYTYCEQVFKLDALENNDYTWIMVRQKKASFI
jgi:hypothetical protein